MMDHMMLSIFQYCYIILYNPLCKSNYRCILWYNIVLLCNYYFQIIVFTIIKDFPKKRYNTYAKSCNSNFYTK